MRTHRRTVALLAGPGINAARDVCTRVSSDALRVATLVEISSAAAALARTIVKLRHLDPDVIAPHVSDPVDLRAVLGRGRWLPTMTRHVRLPECGRVPVDVLVPVVTASVRRRVLRRAATTGQLSLFASIPDAR